MQQVARGGSTANRAEHQRLKADMQVELGMYLRGKRLSLGLRLQDVADAVGTTVPSVSNWERGERTIRAENIAALSEVLQVSPQVISKVALRYRDPYIYIGLFGHEGDPELKAMATAFGKNRVK